MPPSIVALLGGVFLVLDSQAATHSSPEGGAGGCGSGCSAVAANAADEEDRSLGLLQRALRKKAAGGASAVKAASAQASSAQTWARVPLSWAVRKASPAVRAQPENVSCPLLHGAGGLNHVPLTAVAHVEIQALRGLGLLGTGRNCQRPLPVVTARLAQWVADQDGAALMVCLAWGSAATLLVMWSLLSVVIVPRKESGSPPSGGSKHSSAGPKLPGHLADEESAWASGFWNWASLGWIDALMGSYGKCASATAEDADIIKERCDSDYEPHKRFRRAWDEQIQRSGGIENASLAGALAKVIGLKGFAFIVLAVVVEVGLSMVGMVIALDLLLHYLQAAPQPDMLESTIMVIVLVFGVPMASRVASSVVCLLDGHYTNLCAAGLASAVYEKALLLPASGSTMCEADGKESKAHPKPNTVQLLNVDIIEAWSYLLKTLVYTAVAPLAAVALLALLALRLRLAGFFGTLYIVPALLVTWFIQMYNSLSWKRYQRHQDARLSCLTELIVQIRAVKALAWEQLSQRIVGDAREQELNASFACTVSSGCAQASLHSIPWFSLILTLFFLGMLRGRIEAYHVFVIQRIMTSLLSLLQTTSMGLQKLVAAPCSLARIKAFLQQQERPRNIVKRPPLDRHAPAVRVVGSFSFEPGAVAVLRELDLVVPRGELVAVVGSMASGKSALMLAIIGELFPCGTRPRAILEAPSRVAYCAQVPWIFEGTLRENITLNQVFEQERYHRALHAAALLPDLQVLPGGDQATIGSYGIRLSMGQRARVALARAAYLEQAELVLLDEQFGSLDAATSQHVFDELVCGPILRGCTRVVVMHPDSARLKSCDKVVLLEEGRIAAMGTPVEAMASDAYKRLLHGHDQAKDDLGGAHLQPATLGSLESGRELGAGLPSAAEVGRSSSSASPRALAPGNAASAERLFSAPPVASAPVAADRYDFEGRDRFTWSSVQMWFRAAGTWNVALFVVLVLLQRGLFLAETFVLASWVDAKMVKEVDDRAYMSDLTIVVSACCGSFLCLYWATARTSTSASREIHGQVLSRLLQAPIDRFFDRQPLGRLINRLSFDMRQLDSSIAYCMLMLVAFSCGFLLTQGYILSTAPHAVALAVVPLYGVIFFYIYLYRGTVVPLIFRSKMSLSIVQDLQGTVLGTCVSIRANGMRQDFMAKHSHFSASVMRCHYLVFHVAKAWVQSRVALCYSVLTVLVTLAGIWSQLPLGTLANIVSLSFMALSEFEAVSMLFSNLINVLNALQRLARFFDIPQESPAELESDPRIRFSVTLEQADLAPLDALSASSKEVVLARGGEPLLQASEDGSALELVEGRTLGDLAPGSKELLAGQEHYHIVAVNCASGCARRMAKELCSPADRVWLDLWQSCYALGMRVQIEDLVAGYCGDPCVLRGLSLEVPARAKVGLTGRTSCGKSTVLLCILRMLEPRAGRVLLGGLDTSKLGLRALRSIVGLVPQDAAVFEGSWRHNIDPFDEFPDCRIWDALESVGLMPYMQTLCRGLDAEISRGGVNVSFGQKQLLGLARMVVRQPPVLLVDECSCGLDPQAQEAVRNTIACRFPLSTVLAVGNRPETLRMLDGVVVLDNGVVLQQATAEEALQTRGDLWHHAREAG